MLLGKWLAKQGFFGMLFKLENFTQRPKPKGLCKLKSENYQKPKRQNSTAYGYLFLAVPYAYGRTQNAQNCRTVRPYRTVRSCTTVLMPENRTLDSVRSVLGNNFFRFFDNFLQQSFKISPDIGSIKGFLRKCPNDTTASWKIM